MARRYAKWRNTLIVGITLGAQALRSAVQRRRIVRGNGGYVMGHASLLAISLSVAMLIPGSLTANAAEAIKGDTMALEPSLEQASPEAEAIGDDTMAAEPSPEQVFLELEQYVAGLHVSPEAEALAREIFAADAAVLAAALTRTQQSLPDKVHREHLFDPEVNRVFEEVFRDELQTADRRPQGEVLLQAQRFPFVPNRMELALCAAFGPYICATVAQDAFTAWLHVANQSHGNRTYGCGDAFRHAYWSGLMAFDLLPWIAERFGTAHEWGQDPNSLDRRMDLHNNSVGRYHGDRALLRSSVHRGVHRSLDNVNGRPLLYIARGRDGRLYLYASGPWCH
jgi:hypothetical protein